MSGAKLVAAKMAPAQSGVGGQKPAAPEGPSIRTTSILNFVTPEGYAGPLQNLGRGAAADQRLHSIIAGYNPIFGAVFFLYEDEKNPARITGLGISESFYEGEIGKKGTHSKAPLHPFHVTDRVAVHTALYKYLAERVGIDKVELEIVARTVPDQGAIFISGDAVLAARLLREAVTSVIHEGFGQFSRFIVHGNGSGRLADGLGETPMELLGRVERIVARNCAETQPVEQPALAGGPMMAASL